MVNSYQRIEDFVAVPFRYAWQRDEGGDTFRESVGARDDGSTLANFMERVGNEFVPLVVVTEIPSSVADLMILPMFHLARVPKGQPEQGVAPYRGRG